MLFRSEVSPLRVYGVEGPPPEIEECTPDYEGDSGLDESQWKDSEESGSVSDGTVGEGLFEDYGSFPSSVAPLPPTGSCCPNSVSV